MGSSIKGQCHSVWISNQMLSLHLPRKNTDVWISKKCSGENLGQNKRFMVSFLLLFLFLEALISLYRTVQLQLLWHKWSGHRPGSPWYWMVCLGDKQRSFCHFWDCTQVLHFRLSCWLWGFSSSKEFLPTVVDIMVIWIKLAHSSSF